MSDDKIHPMRIVARRTGLSSHVIRVWERRHNAIEPARTPTNRRLYSDADIERLQKLHRATRSGHSISQIAQFSTDELDSLIAADTPHPEQIEGIPPTTSTQHSTPTNPQLDPADYIKNSLTAVRNLDAKILEEQLFRAEIDMGRNKLLMQVIEPLMQQIGTLWSEGNLRIADEHMATSVIRSFLGTLHNSAPSAANAPIVVITTPSGQWHEIGALLASLTATAAGWRAIYLGPNLPAEEIAGVALRHQAQAVALSIIHNSEGDHLLSAELNKLCRALNGTAHILIGGRVAHQYFDDLKTVGAEFLPDLNTFSARLQSLNTAPSA